MKHHIALVILASALLIPATAQEHEGNHTGARSSNLTSVNEIIERYITAIGGKAAIERFKTRITEGTFELPGAGAVGTAQTYEKAPNKYLYIIEFPNGSLFKEGFDGKTWWEGNSQTAKELKGPSLDATRREADFYRDLNLARLYPRMELKGKRLIGDREAYLIEATPEADSTEEMYFDVETGLLVGRKYVRDTTSGKREFEFRYEDYRDVNGMKVPFIRRRMQPSAWVLKVREVRSNDAIDDAKFGKP